ncbi:MAG: hypothetical protein GEV28_16860 [Actinophytocola sp.]|uniref:hypothetical protein n=1 Tax=Actinophytocola sp. TaxID=1872138 RepID=UPI001321BCBA|nr:hypothetical protein [Actinophytocola sp.]MPZ81966.1 hypothetical protein [Actinophytocola sp.]
MTEPSMPAFGSAAGGALAPVAGQVEQVKQHAAEGGLQIDLAAAEVLLRQIQTLRLRSGDLVTDCGTLDTPLKFGDNWVGQIMSERLRTVAVGQDGGATPVLRRFHELLDSVEAIIRLAAGLYQTTDQQAADALHRAAGRLNAEE